jgi:uncharacterized protein (TIGR03437 family)
MPNQKRILTLLLLCGALASTAWGQSGTFTLTSASGKPSFGSTTGTASVTVTAVLNSGVSVDSFSFGILVTPVGSAPAISMSGATFVKNSSLTGGANQASTSNSIGVSITGNTPKLTGTVQLGVLTIPIPSSAVNGQTYTLQFTKADSGDSTTNTDYPITAGPNTTLTVVQTPASLTKAAVSGDLQTATAGSTLSSPFVAVVADANGVAIPSVSVVFTASAGTFAGATSSATVATDASGTATTTLLTLGGASGTTTVTASVAGLPSITYSVTVTTGALAAIAIASGNNQSGFPSATLTNPIVAKAVDSFGNGIDGVPVLFTVTAGGGSVASNSGCGSNARAQSVRAAALNVCGTVVTSGGGFASTTWTLGSSGGANTVQASLPGTSFASVSFNATGVRVMTLNPTQLTFATTTNGSPASQSFTISSAGGALSWTASGFASWISLSATSGTTPSTVTVSINTNGLTPGPYNSSISIASSGASVSPQVVNVSLSVTPGASIGVSQNQMSFTGTIGGTAPAAQTLLIFGPTNSSALSVTLKASTTSGGNWLVASPASGSTPLQASIAVSTAGLSAGTYNGAVTVSSGDASNSPLTVGVTLTLNNAPTIQVTPASLAFTGTVGGSSPASQLLSATLSGAGTATGIAATATTTSGGPWLSVANAGSLANVTASLTVSVNLAGLGAGTYSGSISLASTGASNTPLAVPVTLTVSAPQIQVAPSSLSFTAMQGGANPAAQTVSASLQPLGSAAFTATASTVSGGSWLSVTNGGSANSVTTLNVLANISGLPLGVYTGAVSVASTGASNTPVSIPVTLTIASTQNPPTLAVSPASMLFTTQAGSGSAPATQTFTVQNIGGAGGGSGAIGFTLQVATTNGGGWLAISKTTDVTPSTVTVTATPGSLAQGGYNGSITITPLASSGATGTLTLPVGLAISAPAISPGGVVNAAIFNATVSQGAIISLFGVNLSAGTAAAASTPLPVTLGGTQVLINGSAAPLFYVSPLQINAQMLPGLSGSVTITVVSGTTTGVTTTVQVVNEAPGIFVASGTQGAVLNQDFSPNSSTNPAAAGSVVQIFATGLGSTNPPLASGQPGASSAPFNTTVNPVTATINGQNAPVSFAAAAPGFVGLFQVNATVPSNTPAGNSVSLQLSVNGKSSNTVTICVKAASVPDGQ